MGHEDKKIVRVFTIYGGDFAVRTRMPVDEIKKELDMRNEKEMIELEGLDDADDRVETAIVRAHLAAWFIMKNRSGSAIARPGIVK